MKARKLRDYTKKELEEIIHKRTDVLNRRLKQFYEDGNNNSLVTSEVQKLQKIGGRGRGRENIIGYGIRGKRKEEMILQVRELNYFERWDIFTFEGQKALEEKEKKAYRSFIKNRKYNISRSQWRNMVEIFGRLDSALLEQLGSEQVAQLYIEAEEKSNPVNLLRIINDIDRSGEMSGKTPEDFMDEVRKRVQASQRAVIR